MCLYSSTPGVYTGDGGSVTNVIYGPGPDDRNEVSNVGLGPAGIGLIALGLLLLLCKYWIKSLFSTVLQNKNVTRLTQMARLIWPFLFGLYDKFCGNLGITSGTDKVTYLFDKDN